ncbi:MAG: hypothetical protein O2954_12985, partial [bacterium]|nr:hypothetical protein [bacterium]
MKKHDLILLRVLTLLAFLLVLSAAECRAEKPYVPVQPDPFLESWRWRSFPELSGLGLSCLAEDKEGNMWFGVTDGVRRYDGVNWTAFTQEDGILGAPVAAILGARDGSVYAGTPDGISRFDGRKWQRVFPPEGGPMCGVMNMIEGIDASLWAATAWGALHLGADGQTLYTSADIAVSAQKPMPGLRVVSVPEAVTQVYSHVAWQSIGALVLYVFHPSRADNRRRVVGAVAPGGPADAAGLQPGDSIEQAKADSTSVSLEVSRHGASQPIRMHIERTEGEYGFRSFYLIDVFQATDQKMWFGLPGGGIISWDPEGTDDAAWRLYGEEDGLDIGFRPRVFQTRDGTVWTISEHSGHGVNRFDGKTWQSFMLAESFGAGNVNTSILQTRDGTLWVGGNGGIYANSGGEWRHYAREEAPVPRHRVRLLEASDGALWVAGLGQEAARLDYQTTRWTTYEGLSFGCETPDGSLWFVGEDSSIVCKNGTVWTRYGIEDGLMGWPRALIVSRDGVLWAAGSHDSTAATARFADGRWSLETYPRLASSIIQRGVYAAPDGSVWFGAMEFLGNREYAGGVLRFNGEERTHFAPPQVPAVYYYGIAQTADGSVWAGGAFGLGRYDGKAWTRVTEPEGINKWIDAVYAGLKGDLWVGTRVDGVFHFDGKTWTQYDVRDGLAENNISSILETTDGSVWVCTPGGTSRFDGRTWTTQDLRVSRNLYSSSVQGMAQSRDGAIWLMGGSGGTIRYEPDAVPPETQITLSLKEVSQPGNTTLAWKGADPWKSTPDGELRFSFRMDGGEWSPFSLETSRIFQALPSGKHTFEVKARDRDLNVDPTPAAVVFTVVPPVWREPWFLGLMVVFVGITSWQATRIVAANRKLKEGDAALSMANRDLFGLNRALQRDRAVERVRAEASGMSQSDDIVRVLDAIWEGFHAVGMPPFEFSTVQVVNPESDTFLDYGFGYSEMIWKLRPEWFIRQAAEGVPVWRGEYGFEDIRVIAWFDAETWSRESGWPRQRNVYVVDEATIESLVPFWGEAIREEGKVHIGRSHLVVKSGWIVIEVLGDKGTTFRDEHLDIVEAFTEAATIGYARYFDLRRVEQQNRELTIQNALERVRNKALAMQQTEQLSGIVEMLFAEFYSLGFSPWRTSINIYNQDRGTVRGWGYRDGEIENVERPVIESELKERKEARLSGVPWFTRRREGPDLGDHFEQIKNRYGLAESFVEEALRTSPDPLYTQFIYHSRGTMMVATGKQMTEVELTEVKRFADAFDFAFTRFLDLQKAEAQAKAAARQAAVDRVRAEATAMRSTLDFIRVLDALWSGLKRILSPFSFFEAQIVDLETERFWEYGIGNNPVLLQKGRDLLIRDETEGIPAWSYSYSFEEMKNDP